LEKYKRPLNSFGNCDPLPLNPVRGNLLVPKRPAIYWFLFLEKVQERVPNYFLHHGKPFYRYLPWQRVSGLNGPPAADTVDLSISHLSYLFKNETGQAPCRYLIVLRMEQASELLVKLQAQH